MLIDNLREKNFPYNRNTVGNMIFFASLVAYLQDYS